MVSWISEKLDGVRAFWDGQNILDNLLFCCIIFHYILIFVLSYVFLSLTIHRDV